MARKLKKSKVSICVFCEGESEQAYTDFLKSKFQDVAVFKRPSLPACLTMRITASKRTRSTVTMRM